VTSSYVAFLATQRRANDLVEDPQATLSARKQQPAEEDEAELGVPGRPRLSQFKRCSGFSATPPTSDTVLVTYMGTTTVAHPASDSNMWMNVKTVQYDSHLSCSFSVLLSTASPVAMIGYTMTSVVETMLARWLPSHAHASDT
jgi:hypothetical protein